MRKPGNIGYTAVRIEEDYLSRKYIDGLGPNCFLPVSKHEKFGKRLSYGCQPYFIFG